MSDSVRPHRQPPTRLPHRWDSPGKNIGVGCHFLFQGMKVKSESEVAQSSLTLLDPMDCSPAGSSIHGISQARVPEWVAIAFSNLLPWRPQTQWNTVRFHQSSWGITQIPRQGISYHLRAKLKALKNIQRTSVNQGDKRK